jgi:hypothetical protein
MYVSNGCDALTDAELVTRFEALAIAPSDFRHREHVRLAFAMLAEADFGEAGVRFRRALRAFAVHVGAPGKYHETLTWAYLALVAERMAGCATSFELLERAPELLDHQRGALAQIYDVAAITACPRARRVLVLPTRA